MKRRAITLVEVMIGVILSTVVLGAGYRIWTSTRRDVSTATIRQTLQHEVRLALDAMSADFKSAKRNTFQATKSGAQSIIKFERFQEAKDETKMNSEQTYEVAYVWDSATRTLMRKAKNTTKYLSTNVVQVQVEQSDNTDEMNNSGDPDKAGRKARVDITLAAMRKIPLTNKIATHSEKVSIFVRDEFYSAVNKNKYVSLSELSGKESSEIKKEKDDPLLSLGAISKDQVKNMSSGELTDALDKEQKALEEMKNQAKDVQDQIEGLDTKGDRHWYKLWTKDKSEFTADQENLLKHGTASDIASDIESIEKNLKERESKYIGIAAGNEKLSPDEFERAAFDLKMKDWNIKKSWEKSQEGKKEGEKDPAPPSILAGMNPQSMEKGIYLDEKNNRQTFSETDEAFKARKDYAEKVFSAANKIDIDRLQQKVGDEGMKTYASGKDLLDLANSKLSTVQRKEQHEANIGIINEEISSRR